MGEHGRPRHDDESPTQHEGGAAVRTPSGAGSSPSDLPPPSDSPTVVLPSGVSGSDAPTLVPLSQVPPSDAPTLLEGVSPPPRRAPRTQSLQVQQPMLEGGTVLADRYEILQTLGEGGMGAVYKAKDLELDRMVALKVIRPDLAKNPAIIERFKQELLLSQRVTHRNVIRIYDLGEGDGVKFITMEFIEGQDLRSLIFERKKVSPEEAVEVMEQVCLALDAAHSVDVIHRDLKPQNIMRDKTGRILVMDFGLARTLEGEGMTQTGALVGTMEYMSPEQALAKELDQRSDIFSAGLIFYELLSGQMPYRADSALASLIRRTQERARPISEQDASIPQPLSNIVSKCLEREPTARYQTAKELLADLQAWQGNRTAGAIAFQSVKPWGQTVPWQWITAVVVALALAVAGYRWRDKLWNLEKPKVANTNPEVALAILPFRNASQDPALEWLGPSLADMLSTDVGQSAHLRTVTPDRLHQVLHDLRIGADTSVDPTVLRRVGESSSADTVIWGQYAKFGDQIRIDANVQNLKTGRTTSLKAESSEKGLPAAVDTLADSIRKNLALSSDFIKELQAQSFKPSTSSVDALRSFNQGVQLMRQGKNLDAVKMLQAATTTDPEFAFAFSKLSEAQSAAGYQNDADQSSRKAVDLSGSLPDPERYRIVASSARLSNDTKRAIESYEILAKASPDDTDVQFALAQLYEDGGDFTNARQHLAIVLKQDPKFIDAVKAGGRIENKSGNPQGGLEYFNRALTLAEQVDNPEQRASSLHGIGITYGMLNKPDEALRKYQEALAIRRQIGDQSGIAASLYQSGQIQVQLGKSEAAKKSFQEALQIDQKIGDKAGAGSTLLDLGNVFDDSGDHDTALTYYKQSLQIQRETNDETLQGTCLNNIGSIYYEKAQYEDAQTYFQQALQLWEKANNTTQIVDSVHNLADTQAKLGQYEQAVKQYLRALELRRSVNDSRGAAIESYSLGAIFGLQGRYGAALSSKQEALKVFGDLKDRTFWNAEILSGYGEALALAGRGEEAKSPLEEALNVSRDLRNDAMAAQTLNFQGDVLFYAGDMKGARALYEKALRAAEKSRDKERILISKIDLAKAAVGEQRAQSILSGLRPLVKQAEDQGLRYSAVECSLILAGALMQAHKLPEARQELEGALGQSQKLGLQPLTVNAHYLLATALRTSGDAGQAVGHYQAAVQILDSMQKESGAEKLLLRSDLAAIYKDSTRWSQTKN
jgi:eukaryotic-like serine/threonine-protein kinase